jgi:hypothetical protein
LAVLWDFLLVGAVAGIIGVVVGPRWYHRLIAVISGLACAGFLAQVPGLREAGFVTDVFGGAWIDSDQIDLDLPPEFLSECGRHGLTISLITND